MVTSLLELALAAGLEVIHALGPLNLASNIPTLNGEMRARLLAIAMMMMIVISVIS